MLNEGQLFATVAVKSIGAGKKFYGETLGLKQVDENPGGVMYESGGGKLFVYESETAGSGQATCASWKVSDIESVVQELKDKGVQFEEYEMPDTKIENSIHIMGPMKAAWFKDPDGNVLGVNN